MLAFYLDWRDRDSLILELTYLPGSDGSTKYEWRNTGMHMTPPKLAKDLSSAAETIAIADIVRANVNHIVSDISSIGEIVIPGMTFLPELIETDAAIAILNKRH